MQTLSAFIQSLGWTIVHTIWQSIAIWLVFKIADYALPHQQARAKYALGLLSLLALTTAFVVTFLLQWQHWTALQRLAENKLQTTDLSTGQLEIITDYTPETHNFRFADIAGIVEHYFPLIAIAYIIGTTLMLIRLLTGSIRYYTLRNKNIVMPDTTLVSILQNLAISLGINKNVQLKLSTIITVPVMTGWLKPVIILPLAMVNNMSTTAMEAILLHELAHIRRHDFLVHIFQIVAETLLFFNPLSWHLSRYINHEREHCCDDIVVHHTGQPLSYAHALTTIASESPWQPYLALAATGDNKKPMLLFNRIKRITEMKNQPVNYGRLTAALIVCGLMLTMVLHFIPATAKPESKKAVKLSRKTIYEWTDENGTIHNVDNIASVPDTLPGPMTIKFESTTVPVKSKKQLDSTVTALRNAGYYPAGDPALKETQDSRTIYNRQSLAVTSKTVNQKEGTQTLDKQQPMETRIIHDKENPSNSVSVYARFAQPADDIDTSTATNFLTSTRKDIGTVTDAKLAKGDIKIKELVNEIITEQNLSPLAYHIVIKDGKMFLNEQEQPNSTYKKYYKMMKKIHVTALETRQRDKKVK